MVKLIQTKYIKHLFILTAFAFLLSYQQVAKTITSASDLLDIILSEKGYDKPLTQHNKLLFATIIISDNVADNYEGVDTLKDFRASQNAFFYVRSHSTDPEIIDEAATLVVVQALSLMVGMMDILIEDGERYSDMLFEREAIFDDDGNNPLAAQMTGLSQIAAYEELFSMYLDFLNEMIENHHSYKGIQIIRNAFESQDDYLNGNRAFRQTPECSNLFCSLYTLRQENPDTYITEFVAKQMQINEYFANAVEDARPELRVLVEGFNVEGTNETLNSLRQSKVPSASKTPDAPPAPPLNIPETPLISDDCKMAPSLPGC